MRNRCYVELVNGQPVRILRHYGPPKHGGEITEWPRYDSVRAIRDAIFRRSKAECEKCGKRMTSKQMHMHERISRGSGGEISLANSIGICYDCHLGPDGAHGNRRWGGRREI